ncbi:MAG: tRNA (adenosine(37)-N6)-threonylcarbamoyltransferase complex dimerization subunit type 1 TsaB [Candidatus Omnitrophica bacterium]|nr:tRNA (adenosine(37)-N6)-threonylcarbamoyltransferase complex dimerization subunit type 1 TsaB [Candidatus Omnitrophota bacterium]
MKILGVDTSTKFLCIGVFDGSDIYEYRINLGMGHDVFLIEHIRRILDALKIKIEELDYLTVGIGPGSFTGLRIGISTIKGLGLVLKKKVIGLSILDIIAYNALELEDASYICPILDAKRTLLYTAVYKKGEYCLRQITPYSLFSIEELIKIIPAGTFFLGDGTNLYKHIILTNIKNSRVLDEEFSWPKGTNIIKLAIQRIEKNKVESIEKLKPLYLYPKDCQVFGKIK